MTSANYRDINVGEQVALYFNTLHRYPGGLKGGSFAFFSKGGKTCEAGLDHIISWVTSYAQKGKKDVFATLNTYKKTKKAPKILRSESNLWGLDSIMIDIDGTSELCGREDELISVLEFAWRNEKIPEPNFITFTGGGGVHLYYTFERLPSSMKDSIKALKYAIAEMLYPFEKDFPEYYDCRYHIDFQVFDNQRVDRVPGTINSKTGRVCFGYVQKKERYTYKELLSYCVEEKWSADEKIKSVQSYVANYNAPKTNPEKKGFMTTEQLCQKRIQNMIELVKTFRDFTGRREKICFLLRNWCYQLKMSNEKTEELLYLINSYFSEPLPVRELIGATKVKKVYFFTNERIRDELCLSSEEMDVFFGKSHVCKNKRQAMIKAKIIIAKMTLQGYKGREIAEMTEYSLSQIKLKRADMKKKEGLEYWANYEENRKKELEAAKRSVMAEEEIEMESSPVDSMNDEKIEDDFEESISAPSQEHYAKTTNKIPLSDLMNNYDNNRYDDAAISISEYDACADFSCKKSLKRPCINTSLRSSSENRLKDL